MLRSTAGGTASLAVVVSASLLLCACAGTGESPSLAPCDSQPQKTVKLKIKLKENGAPEKVLKHDDKDGNRIEVCPGDYVSWKLKNGEFSLHFAAAAPFRWSGGRQECADVGHGACEILAVVISDVARDTDLKYTVTTPVAPPLDPVIIVRP